MYNATEYNETRYNWSEAFIATTITDDIIYNWLWLQNNRIKTSFKNDDNFPEIERSTFQKPIVDWWVVLSRRFSKKQIEVKWTLRWDNEEELNNLIDLFKQKLSAVEWFLDIKVNGIYRRTKATAISPEILDRQHFNISQVPYSVTFETLDPFFYNMNEESITDINITGDHSISIVYNWTATSNPRIYFIFETWWSTNEIIFNLNNKRITVSTAISNADVLVFDSIEKTVTLNWVEINYVWSFARIEYWINLLEFEINWSPLLDITLLYSTNYL